MMGALWGHLPSLSSLNRTHNTDYALPEILLNGRSPIYEICHTFRHICGLPRDLSAPVHHIHPCSSDLRLLSPGRLHVLFPSLRSSNNSPAVLYSGQSTPFEEPFLPACIYTYRYVCVCESITSCSHCIVFTLHTQFPNLDFP